MSWSSGDAGLEEKGLRAQLSSGPGMRSWADPTSTNDYLRPSNWVGVRRKVRPLLKPTAYLDGLRGFAALMVYMLHHQIWGHSDINGESIMENVFGWDKQYYFICLPGIRLLFSGGHVAVAAFFVTSGYVLSNKPLRLIHMGETTQLADSLGSALFRRWLRLYIPIICTTFIWLTSWHLFKFKSSNSNDPPPESSYSAELWKWYCDFKNFSFIFEPEPSNAYGGQLWTIPKEFRGSIIVYSALLAFSRSSRNTRLWCEVGLFYYFLYIVDGWYCAAFVMGLMLCDLDMLATRNDLPSIFYRLKPARSWIFYCLLLLGLYLGGVPGISNDIEHLRKSPGWYYLSFFKPQAVFDFRCFFRLWGATFIMISISRISWLRAFFETDFCQYLGRISYGFYLVHGAIHWAIGDRLYAATGRVHEGHVKMVPGWINRFALPNYGPFGLEPNFLLPHLVLLPLTLGLAEVVTKLIDEPAVRLVQWLYNKVLDKSEMSEKAATWSSLVKTGQTHGKR